MIDYKKHKSNFSPYLEKLYHSDKPMIIYKFIDGYKIFTDFSKRIVLNKSNIENFLNNITKKKFKREQDLYVGFFGYEILCNLLNLRIKNQKKNGFYKGLFYKPETIITLSKKIKISSTLKKQGFNNHFNQTKILKPFKINIDFKKYKKIFDLFSKKIRAGETYQIKICTKYKNKSEIDPVSFFWRLMKINSAPESFMIRDKNYSIVSCSPETLIEKKKVKGNNETNSRYTKKKSKVK